MKGARAEGRAAAYLVSLGREIVARNYRVRGGEINLVTREREVLVCTEVHPRGRSDYGSAAESVIRN